MSEKAKSAQRNAAMEAVSALIKEHGTEDIMRSLRAIDPDGVDEVIEDLGFVHDDDVSYGLSGEDEARVAEADAIVAALRDAENMMIAGRRDDARHALYMALPSGARDIFHPTQGLRA